ncbi:MAG: hypothetical protein AAFR87_31265, partial [Bacteroidota bacterium]
LGFIDLEDYINILLGIVCVHQQSIFIARKYKDNWYGTVTYGQRFSGYKDGLLVYTDYTQKNINIVLKVYEPEIEGESQAIWDVLLSNISVTETSQ